MESDTTTEEGARPPTIAPQLPQGLTSAISLVLLPITPGDAWKPDGTENPMLAIILLLLVTIGVSFLLISASGPLLQYWFNRVHPAVSPYRLYAVSNLGSLLGLVSYPFFIEPQLGLRAQTVF